MGEDIHATHTDTGCHVLSPPGTHRSSARTATSAFVTEILQENSNGAVAALMRQDSELVRQKREVKRLQEQLAVSQESNTKLQVTVQEQKEECDRMADLVKVSQMQVEAWCIAKDSGDQALTDQMSEYYERKFRALKERVRHIGEQKREDLEVLANKVRDLKTARRDLLSHARATVQAHSARARDDIAQAFAAARIQDWLPPPPPCALAHVDPVGIQALEQCVQTLRAAVDQMQELVSEGDGDVLVLSELGEKDPVWRQQMVLRKLGTVLDGVGKQMELRMAQVREQAAMDHAMFRAQQELELGLTWAEEQLETEMKAVLAQCAADAATLKQELMERREEQAAQAAEEKATQTVGVGSGRLATGGWDAVAPGACPGCGRAEGAEGPPAPGSPAERAAQANACIEKVLANMSRELEEEAEEMTAVLDQVRTHMKTKMRPSEAQAAANLEAWRQKHLAKIAERQRILDETMYILRSTPLAPMMPGAGVDNDFPRSQSPTHARAKPSSSPPRRTKASLLNGTWAGTPASPSSPGRVKQPSWNLLDRLSHAGGLGLPRERSSVYSNIPDVGNVMSLASKRSGRPGLARPLSSSCGSTQSLRSLGHHDPTFDPLRDAWRGAHT